MTGLPDGVRGQVLAVALLVVALASVWAGVIDPTVRWFEDRADMLNQRRALLRRMEAIAATLPALRQDAETKQASDGAPALLPGATDALAAAMLQDRVQSLAQKTGARVTSEEALPAVGAGPYQRISLRIAVAAPYPILADMLREIEGATPPLIVDDLHLQPSLAVGGGTRSIEAGLTIIAFRAGTSGPTP
jgi:general secretion pathway protein M